jgi:hypothetical protein
MRAISGGMDPVRTGMGGGAPSTSFDDEDRKRGLKKKGGKKGRGGREDEYEDFGPARRGFATGGATIGERLGALRGILGRDIEDDDVDDEVEAVEAEAVEVEAPEVEKTDEE